MEVLVAVVDVVDDGGGQPSDIRRRLANENPPSAVLCPAWFHHLPFEGL